jgi:hypothetical protein
VWVGVSKDGVRVCGKSVSRLALKAAEQGDGWVEMGSKPTECRHAP